MSWNSFIAVFEQVVNVGNIHEVISRNFCDIRNSLRCSFGNICVDELLCCSGIGAWQILAKHPTFRRRQ